jgi:hypothetical protein
MLVRPVRFDASTRAALIRALRRARARPDIPAITTALEETAEVVAVMRADPRDAESTRAALARTVGLGRRLREALAAVRLEADDLIGGALARLGYTPDLLGRLAEGLDMLSEVLGAAEPPRGRPGRRRGAGRASGIPTGITNWLAAEVARTLQAHDVRPTRHRDGVYADVLRALWPAVVGADAPAELQRLLRAAPVRPR